MKRKINLKILIPVILICLTMLPVFASTGGEGKAKLNEGIKLLAESNYSGSLNALKISLDLFRKERDKRGQAETLLWLSRYYIEVLEVDRAISTAGEGLRIYESLKDIKGIFDAKIVLARSLFLRKKIKESRLLVEQVEKINMKGFPQKSLADFYLMRGIILGQHKKFDLSRKNFEEALRIARKTQDSRRAIMAIRELALLYAEEEKFDKARELSTSGLEDAENSDSIYLQALLMETDGEIKQLESKFREARVSFLGALSLYKASGNKGKEGETLINLYELYSDMNDLKKAREYIKKAIKVFKASNNVYGQLRAYLQEAYTLYLTRKAEDAAALQKHYIETARLSSDPADLARAYIQVARLKDFLKGDRPGALKLYKSALKIFDKIDDRKGQVYSLMAIGLVLRNMGKSDDALKTYKKALGIANALGKILKYDDREYFYLCSKGAIYRKMGDVYSTEYRFQDAINLYKKAVKENSSKEQIMNRLLDYVAYLRAALAAHDIDLASKIISTSFKDVEKLEKPEHKPLFFSLVLMTVFQAARSKGLRGFQDYSKTMKDSPATLLIEKIRRNPKFFRQIQSGYEIWVKDARKKKDLRGEIIARLFQGFFYLSIRKHAEAKNYYEMAGELSIKNNLPEMEIITNYFLSDLMLFEGNKKKAIQIIDRTVKLLEKQGDRRGQTDALNHLAYIKRSVNDLEGSLKDYNKSLIIAEKISDKMLKAVILIGRGQTYERMRQYNEALNDAQKALELLKGHSNRKLIAIANADIAEYLAKMGKTDESISYYKRAYSLFKEFGNLNEIRDIALEYGEILQKKKLDKEALAIYIETLNILLDVLNKMPSSLGQYKLSKDSPTRKLFERTITLLIKLGKHKEAMKKLEISRSLEIISSLDLKKVKVRDKKIRGLLEKIQKLRQKMSTIQNEMDSVRNAKQKESLSKILATTRREFFTAMNEIKRKNPDFDQLLSVRVTDLAAIQKVLPDDTLLLQYYPSADALYIFVVSHDSFQIREIAVSRERLYELVRKLRKEIAGRRHGGNVSSIGETRGLLYSILLKPVEKIISKKKKILVIPGGLLWYLPMEILGNEDGPYLIEKKQISYLSSADILTLVRGKKEKSDSREFIAFGAPPEAELPSAFSEIEVLGKLFPKGKTFVGSRATKENFFKEAPGSSILHIATHSSLDREDINKSYILLSGKDGKLYLGEIYGLNLKDSSIVSLSSCQSALGEDNPGREFASLATAFNTSGASSVIASMWKVDDEATKKIFVEFYKNLKSGMSRSESLRQAKIKLIKNAKTSHPFYWGAFILLGDWR